MSMSQRAYIKTHLTHSQVISEWYAGFGVDVQGEKDDNVEWAYWSAMASIVDHLPMMGLTVLDAYGAESRMAEPVGFEPNIRMIFDIENKLMPEGRSIVDFKKLMFTGTIDFLERMGSSGGLFLDNGEHFVFVYHNSRLVINKLYETYFKEVGWLDALHIPYTLEMLPFPPDGSQNKEKIMKYWKIAMQWKLDEV